MCTSPRLIENRNRGHKARVGFNFTKDLVSSRVYVPCGHCSECVQARQQQLIQRIELESRSSYLYFCTLTYDNKHLPRYFVDVPVISREATSSDTPDVQSRALYDFVPTDINWDNPEEFNDLALLSDAARDWFDDYEGDMFEYDDTVSKDETYRQSSVRNWKSLEFTYADIHHIQLLLKAIRNNKPVGNRKLSYICVSELGKEKARPHFHLLFFVQKLDCDDKFTPLNLEKPLFDFVKSHWAVNIGTRKHPIYEPRFTYRKRWYGGRLNYNYDLHWVNPLTTTDGVANVAYYVSKYLMKGSAKENARKSFLQLNLDECTFQRVWDTIKCRMLVSKGLGLNVEYCTDEVKTYERLPLYETLDLDPSSLPSDVIYCFSTDIPEDQRPYESDMPASTREYFRVTVRKRRIMVPDFMLADEIQQTFRKGLLQKDPVPLYIDPNGYHKPLCHYYKRFSWLFTSVDYLDFWFNQSPEQIEKYNYHNFDENEIALKNYKHQKRLDAIDTHGSFDNLSSAMDEELFGTEQYQSSLTGHTRVRDVNNTRVIKLGTNSL